MAQTYETGYKSTLTAKLTAAATTMSLATCPTVTSGRIHLKSATQEEWVSFTGNSNPGGAGNLTGLTRGLSQTADPATSGTGSVWLAGQEVELVAMHDQFIDKNEATTMKNTLSFSNTSVSGLRVQSLTTAQRTALTPTNGEIVYDSDLGLLYSYQA